MNCIMYYTSCADSGGATTGVSKRESGQALTPRTYSVVDDWPVRRSKHHALYAKEQAVEYRPGTAFLYSMVRRCRRCTDSVACFPRAGCRQFTRTVVVLVG
jgi:hypothetical protein